MVNNKRRSILKAISPVPLVPGKATLELDGPHSSQGTANRSPEFYIRLSEEERFGIVRLGEHKGNRVVEKLTIEPVIKETAQEPDLVEVFRQQVADGLFKIWPQKPLDPGEYAVVQYSDGEAGYAGLGLFHRARRWEVVGSGFPNSGSPNQPLPGR